MVVVVIIKPKLTKPSSKNNFLKLVVGNQWKGSSFIIFISK